MSDSHGKTTKLVCPYHQWTYDLDGRLFAARQMGRGFDRARHGLKQLHCEASAGYIFVCLPRRRPDFAPTRAQSGAVPRRRTGSTEARVAFESTIVEEGNWKLVWENNRECYHCAGNHPELARTFPDTPTTTGVSGADERSADRRSPLAAMRGRRAAGHLRALDGRADPHRAHAAVGDRGELYARRAAAVRRALSATIPRRANVGALLPFHYPSTWNHVLADHAISFRVLPLGPTRTQLTTKWLVHARRSRGVDYDLVDLTRVWLATNEQDRRIVQENQIGVSAPSYEPGPFADPHEGGVSQFVDWYCARLLAGLEGSAGELTDVA